MTWLKWITLNKKGPSQQYRQHLFAFDWLIKRQSLSIVTWVIYRDNVPILFMQLFSDRQVEEYKGDSKWLYQYLYKSRDYYRSGWSKLFIIINRTVAWGDLIYGDLKVYAISLLVISISNGSYSKSLHSDARAILGDFEYA